jgi:Cdc6-like AAA superfamily ATPase
MEDLSAAHPSFKALIYGLSGVGKTVGAVSMAQEITSSYKKILYLDTAEGWVSLQNHPELKERVVRMRYINLNQVDALVKALREKQDEFAEYKTVIWDEATSAADKALDDIVAFRASMDPSKSTDMPTQPDYGAVTNVFRKSLTELLAVLDLNVILVGHTRLDKDDRNVEVTKPNFLPKLGQKVKQPLHLIANLSGNEIDEKTYRRIYQVHPTRRIDAKTRIGGLDPQVSYEELISKIKGWMGGDIPDAPPPQLVPDHDPELPSSLVPNGSTNPIEGE